MISRRAFLASSLLAQTAKAATRRPNVIMFMTDDHGAWATGAYGCAEMHTPNIDMLARTGAKFTRAFACTPVCSPSRMTYMTGRLPSTHGVQDWIVPEDSFGPATIRFLDGHPTYAEVLAQNGYNLGMVGKWHMGDDDKAQRGFTYWATIPGGGSPYKDQKFIKNGVEVQTKGMKTDAIGDFALEFIDQQTKEKPFYLLVPFYAPHTPFDFQADPYRKPFENSKFSCFPRTPTHPWQNQGLSRMHGKDENFRSYSALITAADHNIGRVLKRLEEKGMRDDTVVIFTADQGWNAGHHGVWGKGNGTWPFNMFEESLRVPLIWNQPGRIKPSTPTGLVSSYDYFPTILDYVGIKPPEDPKRVGRSYAGLVEGKRTRWRDRLYFEYSNVRGIRTETMKYVERTMEFPSELFDLEKDPGEDKNVINDPKYAKQLETLRKDLATYFTQQGAPSLERWRETVKQKTLTVYKAVKQ